MRMKFFAAALAAAVAVAFVLPADTANAAPKKKRVVVTRDARPVVRGAGTVVTMRDESGRARTRILIQRRSFLDGGTEVLPGERKFTDYVYPPNYSVTGAIDNTAFARRYPLPGPFDLPSKNNPYPYGY
jgi:hypothetical protein